MLSYNYWYIFLNLKCFPFLQHALKRMQSTYFGEKHPFNPFEDITPVEQLSKKYDQSLFAFCSHNKKRPDNVILGKH